MKRQGWCILFLTNVMELLTQQRLNKLRSRLQFVSYDTCIPMTFVYDACGFLGIKRWVPRNRWLQGHPRVHCISIADAILCRLALGNTTPCPRVVNIYRVMGNHDCNWLPPAQSLNSNSTNPRCGVVVGNAHQLTTRYKYCVPGAMFKHKHGLLRAWT